MRADLHVHSIASDGTLTPEELVDLAVANSVDVLAIADHDSVEGLAAARAAVATTSVTLVPAVELSAVAEDGRDVHLLGYFIDDNDQELLSGLADLREARLRRAATMVATLGEAGYSVGLAEVLALADGGAVGRSHVARALVAAGHVGTVADAFGSLIGRGQPFYVPKDVRTAEHAIARIRGAGGVAVVAHPGVSKVEDLLDELADAGLGGIEAYHADHTPAQREHFAREAQRRGLLVTGGSDYHGPDAPNATLGSVDLPASAVRALLEIGGMA